MQVFILHTWLCLILIFRAIDLTNCCIKMDPAKTMSPSLSWVCISL